LVLNLKTNAIRGAWLAEAKTLSFHFAEVGIHINTVSFGGTMTEKFAEHLQQRKSDLMAGAIFEDDPKNILLGHYGSPEDAARVIELMLSEFSNHTTGTNIICDGGLVRRY
jgi:3-oxoacyl-[acyl-carrier protein] reductase